tara:strand:- start:8261 stop:9427 length:1167 start_codon:yes stop_codon:yes gene_type:complete
MTSIVIKSKKEITDIFNEDSTIGKYRIGRTLSIDKPVKKESSFDPLAVPTEAAFLQRADVIGYQSATGSFTGVKSTLWESESPTQLSASGSYYQNSKIRQGVSIRSTFDLEADALPYVYIQGGSSPYPNHIFENFLPSFDEDFFGVKEKLNRRNYVPFEDIIDLHPQRLSASVYLEMEDPYAAGIYPKYSGSHFRNKFDMNGIIEPFELTRRRHDIQQVDTTSIYSARKFFSGISATVMGSEREFRGSGRGDNPRKGSTQIVQYYDVRDSHNPDVDFFDDSREIVILNTDKMKKISALENSQQHILRFFDDTLDYDLSSYAFALETSPDSIPDLLYGLNVQPPYNERSEIGTRFVSAKAGFVYETTTVGNTTLGTDSIAFGGLGKINA